MIPGHTSFTVVRHLELLVHVISVLVDQNFCDGRVGLIFAYHDGVGWFSRGGVSIVF